MAESVRPKTIVNKRLQSELDVFLFVNRNLISPRNCLNTSCRESDIEALIFLFYETNNLDKTLPIVFKYRGKPFYKFLRSSGIGLMISCSKIQLTRHFWWLKDHWKNRTIWYWEV